MSTLIPSTRLQGSQSAFLTLRRVLIAALTAALLTGLLVQIWRSPGLESHDHWTGDLRAGWQAQRMPGEHPRLALVTIGEGTMLSESVRSPISRDMLARLVTAVAAAKPAAIGLDFVIDQRAPGDSALADSIRRAAQSGVPVVLGTIQPAADDKRLPVERLAVQAAFLAAAGNPLSGHLYLREERDGVVRARGQTRPGQDQTQSFAAVLAKSAGASAASLERLRSPDSARRIDWLGVPRNGLAPFAQVPAAALLAANGAHPSPGIAALLAGRAVIIGADLDAVDRYRTPLTRPDETVPGALVHAQIAAQIIDNRHFRLLALPSALALTFLAAFVGVLLGWGWPRSGLLTGVALLVPYFALDLMLVKSFAVIVPFIVPLLSWGGGIMIGEALRMAAGLQATVARTRQRVATWRGHTGRSP
jgi:CHASE2 domain-containing sensor protein